MVFMLLFNMLSEDLLQSALPVVNQHICLCHSNSACFEDALQKQRITCPSAAFSKIFKYHCSRTAPTFTSTDVPVVKVPNSQIKAYDGLCLTAETTQPLLTCNTCLRKYDDSFPQSEQHPSA